MGLVDHYINGVTGAPGVAIGTAWVVFPSTELEAVPNRLPSDIDAEIKLFQEAVRRVQGEMVKLKELMSGTLPTEERVLFDAYVMMLGSDVLIERTIERIRGGNWAVLNRIGPAASGTQEVRSVSMRFMQESGIA